MFRAYIYIRGRTVVQAFRFLEFLLSFLQAADGGAHCTTTEAITLIELIGS